MPNVAQVLKVEILRLARKEAKAQVTPLKKALARDRKVAHLTGPLGPACEDDTEPNF